MILEKSGGSEKQPVGRVILFDKTDGDYSFSNFTSMLRIKDISIATPDYLYYALLNLYITGATRSMQKQTTGIHNLMMEKYLMLPVPIPPRLEQDKIVQSIRIYFRLLDVISQML